MAPAPAVMHCNVGPDSRQDMVTQMETGEDKMAEAETEAAVEAESGSYLAPDELFVVDLRKHHHLADRLAEPLDVKRSLLQDKADSVEDKGVPQWAPDC